MNVLREKLNSGKTLCGTHVAMLDPCLCDLIGRLGFDFIWVDCEHSYLTLKDVLMHLTAANAGGTPVIVRLPMHDYNFTKKVLEMGPDGVIFPMVHSAREAEELMGYTLYPPCGTRGFGPMRAVGYGTEDALSYVDDRHKEMCRLIQIECVEAVDDLAAIARNPWIDACIFGPNDLSASMGHPARGLSPDTQAVIASAIQTLTAGGKPCGVSLANYDAETLAHYAGMGMRILSVGSDQGYVLDGARTALKNAKAAFEGR